MGIKPNLTDCSLLVVIEKRKQIKNLLINAVNFAKRINGEINILCVINPTSMNTTENPLNFIKLAEEEISKIEIKLKKIINIIQDQEKIPVSYKVDFGNSSSVVKFHLKQIKPDVILINQDRLIKNTLTRKIIPDYLDEFKGPIVLSDDKSYTLPKKKFKLSCFKPEVFLEENKVIKKLLKNSSPTINIFHSITNNKGFFVQKSKEALENEFNIFEFQTNNENLGILKYLKYTNSDLLCIDDPVKNGRKKQYEQYINIVNKSKTPLLIIKN